MFKRRCWFCKQEFETKDCEENYCSMECFHADEEFEMETSELRFQMEHPNGFEGCP